jgi:hypothetical protein
MRTHLARSSDMPHFAMTRLDAGFRADGSRESIDVEAREREAITARAAAVA